MDRKKIEELVRLVEESDISELTVSGPLRSVRIVKEVRSVAAPVVASHAPAPVAAPVAPSADASAERSEEHTSELQSHSEISYAVFCLKKKK